MSPSIEQHEPISPPPRHSDSVDSAIWTMAPAGEILDVSCLPNPDSVSLVMDCSDDGVSAGTLGPSASDDGISMNFSLSSMEEGRSALPGIFVTGSSGSIFKGLPGKACSAQALTLSNDSLDKIKADGRSVTPSSVGAGQTPSAGGVADSRASLISQGKPVLPKSETFCSILSQIGLPFLIAGIGMVGAGLLLDVVMGWVVFEEIGELVILVTPLLGLKGNLEMTLASRLSTHSNIGNLDIPGNKWKICTGNLVLDQLQAIVCGLVASVIAMTMGFIMTGKFNAEHSTMVVASSILTASMVSLILGSTMVTVILLSKKFRINPDNVATPVAGSLGDVVTLGMLSCFASIIYQGVLNDYEWIPYVILAIYVVILPVCLWVAYRNEFTKPVVISGWVPLLVSVGISTGGGVLLDLASARFPGVALYQPVINGIGGNLVSVQASRISSYLHGECEKRQLPNKGRICESPVSVFLSKCINGVSARLLLFLAIPGHILFATITHFVAAGDEVYGPLFLLVYVSAAVIQVWILLYIAKILTNLCWKRGVDPDTATIPYLTAMGDFFGSGLLFIAFEILHIFSVVSIMEK